MRGRTASPHADSCAKIADFVSDRRVWVLGDGSDAKSPLRTVEKSRYRYSTVEALLASRCGLDGTCRAEVCGKTTSYKDF